MEKIFWKKHDDVTYSKSSQSEPFPGDVRFITRLRREYHFNSPKKNLRKGESSVLDFVSHHFSLGRDKIISFKCHCDDYFILSYSLVDIHSLKWKVGKNEREKRLAWRESCWIRHFSSKSGRRTELYEIQFPFSVQYVHRINSFAFPAIQKKCHFVLMCDRGNGSGFTARC